jgi:vacuolar-type H+-ATPase subunit E/Vma4
MLQEMLQEMLHQMLQDLLQAQLQGILLVHLLQEMLVHLLQEMLVHLLQEMLEDLLQEMPGVCLVISMLEQMLVQEEMHLTLLSKEEIRSFVLLVLLDHLDVHVPDMVKTIL